MGRKKNKKQPSGLDELFGDYFDEADENEFEEAVPGGEFRGRATTDMFIHPAFIEPDPDQPRKNFDDESIAELAESIKKLGMIQPLIIRPIGDGTYRLIAGERRWRAARLAGINNVPVVIRDDDERTAAMVALVENLQREDLDPVEEAGGYQSLMDRYGLTQQQVADSVGKPRSSIANSLRLLGLCEYVKALLSEGKISAGHAKLIAAEDSSTQEKYAKLAAEEQLSVRELEKIIAADKVLAEGKKKPKAKPKKPQFLTEAELALKQTFGQPVKIEQARNGKTKLTIECKNDEEFRELMKKLSG
ncbi:MAG: ParB/RepB/Spo0J family partition protein [Ruminococcus sp.]|nr:ParB/RepB/Spo0J family partition protein [Ruminococcus sp.]